MPRQNHKFRVHNGLSAYALACGYIQRVELLDRARDIRIDLWQESCAYHVRVHNFAQFSGRLLWESFDTLAKAKTFWHAKVREYVGADLKAIQKDGRYTVAREHHGEEEPSWVARWCADTVIYAHNGNSGSFGCSTREQALARCFSHNYNRMEPFTRGAKSNVA